MRRSSRLRIAGAPPTPSRLRGLGERLLRAAVIVGVVVLCRWRFTAPAEGALTVTEVRSLLPEAARLEPDRRGGHHVFDEFGLEIGYAITTLPEARDVVGYAGPTDALVVFDRQEVIAGIRIRHSADTVRHVEDVQADEAFMGLLDGLTWQQAAAFDLRSSAIDAVSGATLTSRALMGGVIKRLGARPTEPPWVFGARDGIIVLAVGGGLLMAFFGRRVRRPFRLGFALATVLALGFTGGDFVTQGVLLGWAKGGLPLRTAPGLALLCAIAFLLPWMTGRAVYCQQICPHGLVQDLVARLSPVRLSVRADLRRALRWGPLALVVICVAWTVLEAPVDLAQVEPFQAYLLTAGAGLSIAWAVLGLVAAAAIPRAYCRFGCPTGAMLELVRVRGARRA